MKRRRPLRLAVAGLALVVAVGCSDDDGDAESTTSRAPTPEEVGTVPNTADSTPPVGVDVVPPVGIDESSEFEGGVSASVTAADDVSVDAIGAGETSGPAVAVTVEFTNDSAAPVDLDGLAVTARGADGLPMISSRGEPADDLAGTLEPGASETGVYVFRVDERRDTIVELSHSAFARVLTFRV